MFLQKELLYESIAFKQIYNMLKSDVVVKTRPKTRDDIVSNITDLKNKLLNFSSLTPCILGPSEIYEHVSELFTSGFFMDVKTEINEKTPLFVIGYVDGNGNYTPVVVYDLTEIYKDKFKELQLSTFRSDLERLRIKHKLSVKDLKELLQ
jgi:hypothetical protein